MVNHLTLPVQGLVLSSNMGQRQRIQSLQHQKNGNNPQATPVLVVSDEEQAVTSAPPAIGGQWVLCRDQKGRVFWLNSNTGQWTYTAGATAAHIMQPPPPPQYVNVSQVAQPQANPAWTISPPTSPPQQQQQQMMWVPVGVSPAPSDVDDDSDDDDEEEVERSSKSKSKVVYPGLPRWEECWNAEGKVVWIHRETGKLVHTDPYD